jgi:hypothetical protein
VQVTRVSAATSAEMVAPDRVPRSERRRRVVPAVQARAPAGRGSEEQA